MNEKYMLSTIFKNTEYQNSDFENDGFNLSQIAMLAEAINDYCLCLIDIVEDRKIEIALLSDLICEIETIENIQIDKLLNNVNENEINSFKNQRFGKMEITCAGNYAYKGLTLFELKKNLKSINDDQNISFIDVIGDLEIEAKILTDLVEFIRLSEYVDENKRYGKSESVQEH